MMTMTTESRVDGRPMAPLAFFSAMAARFVARRRGRRIVRDLAAMDDHILSDIGLTRIDLMQADISKLGKDRMAWLEQARSDRIG